MNKAIGLAYVCDHYYGGMGTQGYRILSRLYGPYYRMRRSNSACQLVKGDWDEARSWAARFLCIFRKRRRRFASF